MADLIIRRPTKDVKVVFPQDLGRGIKANQAAKQFEVDLTEYVGTGITYADGRLNVPVVDLAPLTGRVAALESKQDKFVQNVVPSRQGNTVTLTYNFSDGSSVPVSFEDKDTVTLAFDPTSINNEISAIKAKNGSQDTEIAEAKAAAQTAGNSAANFKPKTIEYTADGKIKLTLGDNTSIETTPVQINANSIRLLNAWNEEIATVVQG